MNPHVGSPFGLDSGRVRRREGRIVLATMLTVVMLGGATLPAQASTGGSATATAVDLSLAASSVLGVPLTPAINQTYLSASTPAPDATGNGSNVQQSGSLDEPGVFSTGLARAETHRTPAGLTAHADVRNFSIGLLGVADLVSADDLSSTVVCPILEGAGVPTVDTMVTNLEVAGTPASPGAVDIPVAVPLVIPGVASAEFLVSLTQVETTTATSASGTALNVSARLVVLAPLGVELLNQDVLDVDLAQSACTAPNAMDPVAFGIAPDSGPIGTPVVITGAGFVPGETSVQFGALVVGPGNVTVPADGTRVSFAVPSAATPGVVQVRATTPGGTTGPLDFTVTEGADGGGGGPGSDVCAQEGAILGTTGDDVMVGTPGDDVLCGLAGDDVLRGLSGDDVIIAGPGQDTAAAGDGDDMVRGGAGQDLLDGDAGLDAVFGGGGNDELLGSAGADSLRGQKGADTLRGVKGPDVLSGGAGPDSLSGGAKRDTVRGAAGNDALRGGGGRDVVKGGKGNDVLKGGAGSDMVDGGPGADACAPGTGNGQVKKCEG